MIVELTFKSGVTVSADVRDFQYEMGAPGRGKYKWVGYTGTAYQHLLHFDADEVVCASTRPGTLKGGK